MTKVNPNSGNKTKSANFPLDIFGVTHYFVKKYNKVFQ